MRQHSYINFFQKLGVKIIEDRKQDKQLHGIDSDLTKDTTEICPDGKSYGLPKYVDIRAYG